MSISHWMMTTPSARTRAPNTAPPRSRLDCDLCVVGAGICGMSAALEAQRRGLTVEVLERGQIAIGASGRNAGFLMRGAADHYEQAISLYGRQRAAFIWRWTEENLQRLREAGVESLPGYRRVPSCLVAISDSQEQELRRSADLLTQDGFDVQWADANQARQSTTTAAIDTLWRHLRPRGGLINPNDAAVNPVELVRMLAAKLNRPAHEGIDVRSIEPDGAGVRVISACGTVVHARRVLLASNAYAGLLSRELQDRIKPRRGQMLALNGEGLTLTRSYYLNHGSEYVRQAADGTVVVGGCRTYFADRETGYDDEPTPWTQSALEAFAASVLGFDSVQHVRERTIARWAGIMGFSQSGLPLIEPVSSAAAESLNADGVQRAWFCGGFTGHGMSMGYRTAQAAVGVACFDEPNPLAQTTPQSQDRSW